MGIIDANVKELEKLETYLINQGRKEFVTEVQKLDVKELESRLLGLAKAKEQIANSKKADKELKQLQEKVREMNAPYSEQTRMNAKLARYVALLLEENDALNA